MPAPLSPSVWLIAALAFVPVVAWLALFFVRDREREPASLLEQTFVFGMLSTFPILVYRFLAGRHPDLDLQGRFLSLTGKGWLAAILFFLVVALVEEYVKHIAMILTVERHRAEFNQIVDGIVYGVAAAMGFAFIENAVYLNDAARNVLVLVFVSRALGATFGHAIFSGSFGYFYARAAFTKVLPMKGSKRNVLLFHLALFAGMGLHIIRTHLIPRRGVMEKPHTQAQLLAEGYWVAVFLHLLYDLLATSLLFLPFDLSWVIAPLLMLAGGWLFHRFAVPTNQKQRKVLANLATLPEWLVPTQRARKIRKRLGLSEGL